MQEGEGARRGGRCDGSCPLFLLFSEPGLAGGSQRAQTVLMSSHVCGEPGLRGRFNSLISPAGGFIAITPRQRGLRGMF